MKPIEERLGRALRARADQVRPEDLSELPEPAELWGLRDRSAESDPSDLSDRSGAPGPRRTARLRPLLAVAAVVLAVAVVASLPRLVGGRDALLAPAGPSAQATCWDGAEVADLAECSLPDGVAGLRWVFPSFDPDDPACVDAKLTREGVSRPTMWICTVTGPSGGEVRVRYSQIRRVQSGLTHYIDKFRGAEQEIVAGSGGPERYVWRTKRPEPDGLYKLSSMYVGYPYSASVDAADVVDREHVFGQVLRFRPAAQMRGLDR